MPVLMPDQGALLNSTHPAHAQRHHDHAERVQSKTLIIVAACGSVKPSDMRAVEPSLWHVCQPWTCRIPEVQTLFAQMINTKFYTHIVRLWAVFGIASHRDGLQPLLLLRRNTRRRGRPSRLGQRQALHV